MAKRHLRRYLFWPLVALTVASLAAAALYTTERLRSFFLDQMTESLSARARLFGEGIRPFDLADTRALDAQCKREGKLVGTRFTVIAADGRVLGDSDHDPLRMVNHSDRPEVRAAQHGELGVATHFSATLQTPMLYVALPTRHGPSDLIIRAALPLTTVQDALYHSYVHILLGGLVIALLAAWLSWMLARRLSAPIRDLVEGVRRFGRGELGYELAEPDVDELAELARGLNRMAADLAARIREISEQRNELDAVLGNMVEAVLLVDQAGHLLHRNRAAITLFGLDPQTPNSEPLNELIPYPSLWRLVVQSLATQVAKESELVLSDAHGERHLQTHVTPLRDRTGAARALIVLADVTRLKRLETMRRDFVANVSHELRTPITSIKGYVETLKDGALDSPDDAHRFLDVIGRHADRLHAIIEDLLSLSRLEQGEETGSLEKLPTSIAPLVGNVFEMLGQAANEKGIALTSRIPSDLTLTINAALIEQALVNLVDNAIKYSPRDAHVSVEAAVFGPEARLCVRDDGIGIPAEDLPRIFERFYRVDKARSRQQGGTGLGLGIVKHIAQAHGGKVLVDSSLGHGSTFTLVLPLTC